MIMNKSSSEFIHVYIHYVGLVIDTGSLMLIANVTREVCIIYIHMELYSIQIGVEVLFNLFFLVLKVYQTECRYVNILDIHDVVVNINTGSIMLIVKSIGNV